MLMITYAKVIDETPEEYYVRLRNRSEDETRAHLSAGRFTRNQAGYIRDGYEYAVESIPQRIPRSGKIQRLEYYVSGKEIGNEDGPHRREVGCVVLFFRREDKKTDVVAELHHPAFEPEFRSIFGIDEQKQGGLGQANTDAEAAEQEPSTDKLSRRERNHRLRIIAGLVRWRNETAGDPIDDLTYSDAKLISKQAYRNYIKDNLAYTTDDLAKRGSSFHALWNAYRKSELEQAITKILDSVDEM